MEASDDTILWAWENTPYRCKKKDYKECMERWAKSFRIADGAGMCEALEWLRERSDSVKEEFAENWCP